MKENPKIKPSDLQKRIKKKGIVLNSDGSSEIDPKQDHQLANFDIGSVERCAPIGEITDKKSKFMRPC